MENHEKVLLRVAGVETRRDLWHVLFEELSAFGVTMASYHATDSEGMPLGIASSGFPDHWVCKYLDEELVHIDPIPELAAKMAKPFYWHDIETLAPSSTDAKRYLTLLNASDVGDGLALYVFGPGLQNAYVGLGFGQQKIELDPTTILQIQSIAQAGHLRFCELQRQAEPRPHLSAREMEILDWVAKGKSNSVIADILAISQHTVDSHMRRIYGKLGVSDRVTAALRGVGGAMLQLS